jgi:hypothetical protein
MAWENPVTTWGQAGKTVPGAGDFNRIEGNTQYLKDEADSHKADYTLQVPFGGTTTNSGNNYSIASPAISALTAGMAIAIKINANSTGATTLNWNGKGAKPIKKANGTDVTNLKAGGIYTLRYDGTNFILQGEGASGNATASDLLSGKTATTDAGEIVGTMPNRGAVANTITTQGGQYTIPAGYHNGAGKITASFANLVAGNIKSGVNIGGVVGELKEGAIISTQHGLATMANNTRSLDISISSVNLGKAIIILSNPMYTSTSYTQSQSQFRCSFVNSSKINISRGRNAPAVPIRWSVIEFSDSANVQVITKSISYTDSTIAPVDVSINSVDVARCFVVSGTETPYVGGEPRVYISSPTNLRLDSFYAHAGGTTYTSTTTAYIVEI